MPYLCLYMELYFFRCSSWSFIPCPYFLTELCCAPFLFCNKVLLYSFFPVIWYFTIYPCSFIEVLSVVGIIVPLLSLLYIPSSTEVYSSLHLYLLLSPYPCSSKVIPYPLCPTYCSSTLLHCTANPIYVFPENKLRRLVPNSYIHWSVSDLYPRIGHR